MTPSVLYPNWEEDRERAKDEIRRGKVRITYISGSSSVRKQTVVYPRKDEWDKQIEEDAKAGRLDEIARKAKEDYENGRTNPL